MTTAAPADFQVEFQLPPDFREILPGASPEEAQVAVAERFAGVELSPEAVAEAVRQYLAASELLARTGVFYAATCLGLIDGHPSLSSLVLARTEADCRDPEVAVEGIVRIMGRGQGSDRREVKRYDLPCGPAAVAVSASDGVVLSAQALGTDADLPIPFATLQAYVPVPASADPARASLVVVTFSTPSVRDWEVYCPVIVDFLNSLTFPTAANTAFDPFAAPTSPRLPAPAPVTPPDDAASNIRRALG